MSPAFQLPSWLRKRERFPRKIDLGDQRRGFYGQHRSGWSYAMRFLGELQKTNGVWLDAFIERTFCWHPDGPRANLRPWVGFIHVPPRVPEWFQGEQSNDAIFRSELWQRSLPFCQGLFAMSKYHRRCLEQRLDLPIDDLTFPTEAPRLTWSRERFAANREKKVVQVGWWLRRLHSIFLLPARSYKKVFLRITHADLDSLLVHERRLLAGEGRFDDSMYQTAEQVSYLPPAAYDTLLAENVVLLDLYDASANNTVVECIARATPLLVNRLEAVAEYLGDDYPLYFTTLEEAADKLETPSLLLAAHEYLQALPIRNRLGGEAFLTAFAQSPIYRSL